MSDGTPTDYTADRVAIREGLRVWTNDLEAGEVRLAGSFAEVNRNRESALFGTSKLWFEVLLDSGRTVLQSTDRVATRHPVSGVLA